MKPQAPPKRKTQTDRVPPRSVLVPVDFSDCSMAGLAAAKVIAGRWNSPVNVLHVDSGLPTALSENMDSPAGQRRREEHGRLVQERLVREAADFPSGRARFLEGDAAEAISRIAAGAGADLIVMGTHGHTGIRRFVMGSVAERVVHASRVPVLTAHSRPQAGWPRKILAPMKFTGYADEALLYAEAWTREFGASMTVLHVVENPDCAREDEAALEEHLQRLLSEEEYHRLGRIMDAGRPAENIIKVAETGRFDLIVLAAHLKPFWSEVILGTTAERVLRHASVPVLSVPSSF